MEKRKNLDIPILTIIGMLFIVLGTLVSESNKVPLVAVGALMVIFARLRMTISSGGTFLITSYYREWKRSLKAFWREFK